MRKRFQPGNNVEYRNPAENKERGDKTMHTFELELDGTVIGRLEATYYSKPTPLYFVNDLRVAPEQRGKGNASAIMDALEEFLRKKGKTGVLNNGIEYADPAYGMYERRGWQEIPGQENTYVFNLPSDLSIDEMENWELRGGAPLMQREGGYDYFVQDKKRDIDEK